MQQRYNERQIRKWKRVRDCSLTEEARGRADGKVKAWQAKQRELLKAHPDELRRDYPREQLKLNKKGLTNEVNSDIIKHSAGASGALNPYSEAANKHAELYYEEIRKRKSDVEAIAKNTKFSAEDIDKIKKHLFMDEIRFEDGRLERFSPDFMQSQAWQRLIDGNYTDNDMLLLNHELEEINYMHENNAAYETAHKYANQKYNWERVILEIEG
jgi:hypothetical protein